MKYFLPLFAALTLIGCSGSTDETSSALPADSLFAFKNIKNTLLVHNFHWDDEDVSRLWTDSTKQKSFVRLDSNQMRKYIVPLLDIDSDYVVEYMVAHLISNQDTINGLTPIIVSLNGDDYSALIYILLNKDGKPVSHFMLHGGECAGPGDVNDSLISFCPIKHSYFEGDKIKSYELKVYERVDTSGIPHTIDSICFQTSIKPDGTFETKQTDSIRYKRMVDWSKE